MVLLLLFISHFASNQNQTRVWYNKHSDLPAIVLIKINQ